MIFRNFVWCLIWTASVAIPYQTLSQSLTEGRYPIPEINTGWPESHPSISLDGKVLYFSRSGYRLNMGSEDEADVWQCYSLSDSTWSIPVNAGVPVNSIYPDHLIGNGISGNQFHVLRTEELPIFYAISGNSRKRHSEELPIFAFSYPNAADFYVSSNGKLLFFAMDDAEGYGGSDIYVSYLESDGTWGPAKNLGAAVNSRGDEKAPFLAADGKTLYFSSNGRGGFGGQDLFVSFSMSDEHWNEWTLAQNLGSTINAETDESQATLAAAGEQLLFTVRKAGTDSSDIYRASLPRIYRPQPVLLVEGNYQKNLQIKQIETSTAYLFELYYTLEKEADTFSLVLPYGANLEISSRKEGYFWCAEVLELAYQALESPDEDTTGIEHLLQSPEYLIREAEIVEIQQEMLELQKEVEKMQTQQEVLLGNIREKALQIPINSPNPDLEVDRIVLMLSALPDTFIRKVTIALKQKQLNLMRMDSIPENELLSPEVEKQIKQNLVFDLRKYIDAHNQESILLSEQNTLKNGLGDRINLQINAEKQFSAQNPAASPTGFSETFAAGQLRHFDQVRLDCQKIPIQAGNTKVLQNIYFEKNTALLKKYAENELERLVELLKKNTRIVVEISAHTHTGLGHSFAEPLSRDRAEAVAAYLIARGIEPKRLKSIGYGKTQPLITPDSDSDQKERNQRIEIRIIN